MLLATHTQQRQMSLSSVKGGKGCLSRKLYKMIIPFPEKFMQVVGGQALKLQEIFCPKGSMLSLVLNGATTV